MYMKTFKGSLMKQKRNFNSRPKKDETIMNEKIRARQVRLVDENGEQVGVVDTSDALRRAEEVDLDLVLVSANAEIPVAKIINYGKHRYEMQKKQKENKANQNHSTLKEVRVSPTIDQHDFEVKLKQARKFLSKGDKVQFSLRFKGRMITHAEIGRSVMQRVMEELKEEVTIDQYPKMDGRKMFLVVSPIKKK